MEIWTCMMIKRPLQEYYFMRVMGMIDGGHGGFGVHQGYSNRVSAICFIAMRSFQAWSLMEPQNLLAVLGR